MRPEDILIAGDHHASSAAVPIDVALGSLDAELETTGARARRMLNGQRQPTRYFTLELRRELLEALATQPGTSPDEQRGREVPSAIRR